MLISSCFFMRFYIKLYLFHFLWIYLVIDKLVIKIFLDNKLKKKHLKGKKILKEQNKITEYLFSTENLYKIKVEDTIVEMEYSDNKKTFNECMLNILKQKYKKG